MPFYIDNITTGLQVNDNFDFLEYDKFMTVKHTECDSVYEAVDDRHLGVGVGAGGGRLT